MGRRATGVSSAIVGWVLLGWLVGCSGPEPFDQLFTCDSDDDCRAPLFCAVDNVCRAPNGTNTLELSPAAGRAGTLVTLRGDGLDAASVQRVRVGQALAPIAGRSGNAVQWVVPSSARSGPVEATLLDGTTLVSSRAFSVLEHAPVTWGPTGGVSRAPTDSQGAADFGAAVAVSGDGKTVLVGGPVDDGARGAVWTFVGGAQRGAKVVRDGPTAGLYFAQSVALNADGTTALVGAPGELSGQGVALVYSGASAGSWAGEPVALGAGDSLGSASLGRSVALSADGRTAVVGGHGDTSGRGATWVFQRAANGQWAQQAKLVGTAETASVRQGISVGVSADGDTVVTAGFGAVNGPVTAWVFARRDGRWAQQGEALGGTGLQYGAGLCAGVAISGDGRTIALGGDQGYHLHAWVFVRSAADTWATQGPMLTFDDALGVNQQSAPLALSFDGRALLAAGPSSPEGRAALWSLEGETWTKRGLLGLRGRGYGRTGFGTSAALSYDAWSAVATSPDDTGATPGLVWFIGN